MLQDEKKVIIVDEQDHEVGLADFGEAHKKSLLHRIVVVYVTNPAGQILIQERKSGRLDHSAAGHVDEGEDYLTAAERELQEELGITVPIVELGKAIADKIEPESGGYRTRHVMMVYDCMASPEALDPDEVKSVFWADPKEVYKEMETDPENEKYCGSFKVSLGLYLDKKMLP